MINRAVIDKKKGLFLVTAVEELKLKKKPGNCKKDRDTKGTM